MEVTKIDAHVDRLKSLAKHPELVEQVEEHRDMLYSLLHSPSGRRFLDHPALSDYLDRLEKAFGKSSANMQRNLIRAFDEILNERSVAILSELPPDHGVHNLISRAISRRHTNALSLTAAALLDFKYDLDEEGFYQAHPDTLAYLDYFHTAYPRVGRHRLGDAARMLLRLATHDRLSKNGPVSLRIRLADAMKRWSYAGIMSFRGFRRFSDLRDYLRRVATHRGLTGNSADLFVNSFMERVLNADLADKIFMDVSRSSMREMPSSAARNVMRMVREFPELVHAVHVARGFPYNSVEEMPPVHTQAMAGLHEFFMHYALGQAEEYKERLFRRWAAEASEHIFGKSLRDMDAEQRGVAERYLRDVWNAMNTGVKHNRGEFLFGKTHVDHMLRSLYTEISCFTPYKGSGNVPEAMGVIFLPHVREADKSKYSSRPIIPSFAVFVRDGDPVARVLTHFDYKSGRLILGSYGGSIMPKEAEQAATKYAKRFNEQLDDINKRRSEELSQVHLLPRISRIREIIVGDQSEDFRAHVVHPGEILPFYGDYLDKAHRKGRVESIVYGRKKIVE